MDAVLVLRTDASVCRGCQACALACSLWHEGQCGPSLSRVLVTKDMARYEFDVMVCRNCETPDCVGVCPSDALVIDAQGRVVLHEDNCTQCGSCAEACPYNAIFFSQALGRYLKCDLCTSRDEGPLCVSVCPSGALTLAERNE